MTAPTTCQLTGRIGGAALPALLQILNAIHHTGTVTLEGPGATQATILVQNGRVTHAETPCRLPLSGFAALRAILAWPHADLEMTAALPASAPVTVDVPIMQLLLAAAQRDDELVGGRDDQIERLPVRMRHNLAAYPRLEDNEWVILRKLKLMYKTRNVVHVADLVAELPGIPVKAAVRDLAAKGLVHVDGLDLPAAPQGHDARDVLTRIVPVRTTRATNVPLEPSLEQVFALVNGARTANDIARSLRLTP